MIRPLVVVEQRSPYKIMVVLNTGILRDYQIFFYLGDEIGVHTTDVELKKVVIRMRRWWTGTEIAVFYYIAKSLALPLTKWIRVDEFSEEGDYLYYEDGEVRVWIHRSLYDETLASEVFG